MVGFAVCIVCLVYLHLFIRVLWLHRSRPGLLVPNERAAVTQPQAMTTEVTGMFAFGPTHFPSFLLSGKIFVHHVFREVFFRAFCCCVRSPTHIHTYTCTDADVKANWPKLQSMRVMKTSSKFIVDEHFEYIKTIGIGAYGIVM